MPILNLIRKLRREEQFTPKIKNSFSLITQTSIITKLKLKEVEYMFKKRKNYLFNIQNFDKIRIWKIVTNL